MKQKMLVTPRYNVKKLFEELRHKIISLKFIPGQMISENDIAGSYGVSRTIVRGALQKLKNENLVVVFPQRGTYVSYLNYRQIMDLVYMRSVVEYDICRQIENKLDLQVREKLERNLLKQENLCASIDNIYEFNKYDEEYHQIYYEAAGRKYCWSFMQQFQASYIRYRLLDMIEIGNLKEVYSEHVEIFDVITGAGKANLREVVDRHISGNIVRLEEKIKTIYKDYFA